MRDLGVLAWGGLALACALVLGCGKWKASPTRAEVTRAMAASTAPDSDGDGLPNDVERQFAGSLGTNPELADSDGDGLNDAFEVFGAGWLYVASGGKAGALQAGASAGKANDPTRVHGMDELVDTDGDGVSDFLEYAGYRYDWQAGRFVLDAGGYHTDPLQWSTDQDAYSDGMEASKINMDVAVRAPGNDPLVPAYPDIVVELVGYSLTANETITEGSGGQISKGQTWNRDVKQDHTTWHEVGFDVGTKVSATQDKGFGLEVSATYRETWKTVDGQSISVAAGGNVANQVNWSRARSYNPSEAARITLRVKVSNRGTAPASNVVPTLNIRVGGTNVATFTPSQLEIGTLPAGATYPAQAGATLVIESDGTGKPLTLTESELRALESGAPITLAVVQKRASVMRFTPAGTWERVGDAGEYMTRIAAVSTELLVDLGQLPGGDQARLLHALVYSGDAPPPPGSTIRETPTAPRVTVREALSRAFGFAVDDETGYSIQYPEPDGGSTTVPLGAGGDGIWRWGIDARTLQRRFGSAGPATSAELLDLPLGPSSTVTLRAPRPAQEELPTIHVALASAVDQGYEVVVCASDYDGVASVTFIDRDGRPHPLSADARGPCFYSTVLDGYAFAGGGLEQVRVESVRTHQVDGVDVPLECLGVVSAIYTPVARPPILRRPTYDDVSHRFYARVEPGGDLDVDQVLWVKLFDPRLGDAVARGSVALQAPPNAFEDPYGWEVYLENGWFKGMRLVAYSKGGKYSALTINEVQDLQPYASGTKEFFSEFYWMWPMDNSWHVEQEDLDAAGDIYNWFTVRSDQWPNDGTARLLTAWKDRYGGVPDVYLKPSGPPQLVYHTAAKRVFPGEMGGQTAAAYWAGLSYQDVFQGAQALDDGFLVSELPGTDARYTYDLDSVFLYRTNEARIGKARVSHNWVNGGMDHLITVSLQFVTYKNQSDLDPVTAVTYASASVVWSVGQDVTPLFPNALSGGAPETYELCRWFDGITWASKAACWPRADVLPAGLEFSDSTGAIYGRPAAAGEVRLVVFASNQANRPGFSDAASTEVVVRILDRATLAYSRNAFDCPTGQPGQPTTTCVPAPAAAGALTTFAISPQLPGGLTLATPLTTSDPAQWGAISGTPIEVTPVTTYTVTVSNAAGDRATTSFTLATPLGAPSGLAYPADTYRFTVRQALPGLGDAGLLRPTYQGGTIERFTISPALPPDLTFDPDTGMISGTPTVAAATAAYEVTGTNATAATSRTLTLTVDP